MTATATLELELTLRGLSPDALHRQVKERCLTTFGGCPFQIDEESCVVCLRTLGGRPRLWETHVLAHALAITPSSD